MIVIDDNHRLKKLLFDEPDFKNFLFQYVKKEDFLTLTYTSNIVILDADSVQFSGDMLNKLLQNEVIIVLGDKDVLETISKKKVLPQETLYIDYNTNLLTLFSTLNGVRNLFEKQENYRNQLVDFDQKISGIVDVFEEHLIQIKKIYDRVVFFRKESVKNIQLYSKYCAGRSPGGDYFDAFSENSKFYLYCTTTNSYLLSNLLMKLFLDLKTYAKKDVDLKLFIHNLEQQVRDTFRNDKKVKFDFCIKEINLNNLKVTYYRSENFGIDGKQEYLEGETSVDLLPASKVFTNTFNLKHGDRILVHSPGFKSLWSKYCKKEDYLDVFNNQDIYPKDIVDELAFQLRSKNTGYFLDADSSTILLEVNKNAVLEV